MIILKWAIPLIFVQLLILLKASMNFNLDFRKRLFSVYLAITIVTLPLWASGMKRNYRDASMP